MVQPVPYTCSVNAHPDLSSETTVFCRRVYELVARVPPGRVTTYGDIALALGRPRHARLVGYALSVCPGDIPAQRVVNHRGEASRAWNDGHPEQQRALLLAEGVTFRPDGTVDLKKHICDLATVP
jgi:methylated-DNA-protein-cysteine methyltransferase related protein